VEADGVVYTPAVSLRSLVERPRLLGFLIGETPGAFRCRHLWPPAIAEGQRPVRLVRGGVGLTPMGAVRVLEFPEEYPAYYTRSVLRLYGLDGRHIAEPVYIPGGVFTWVSRRSRPALRHRRRPHTSGVQSSRRRRPPRREVCGV
jgi:hypothetical protein